ncbi:DnaD domain-containing protein [Streptococcus parauberis]|uniref:DnaD domain-containing protein n=1 Tax=Streptococcus parauberis TaxID=1348 RepID=UPI000C150D08|nr:DnaD domain protein [Streptococcus parauberis]PIA83692.1 Replication initiation and membrane attachment [Streptococcus parauberis]
MAQRRMFSKRITDTDKFLDMSLSTQALYFHLNMAADDDGFIDRPKTIQRTIGASEDDFKILVAKQFIVPFDSGVVVIKDWYIHNFIRKDTYQPTLYQEEKRMIEHQMPRQEKNKKASKKYVDGTLTERQQLVDTGKDRIGKDRIGKDRIDEDNLFHFIQKNLNINYLSPTLSQKLNDYVIVDGLKSELLFEAVRITALNGIQNINYTISILDNWVAQGLKTLEEVNAKESSRKNNTITNDPNAAKFEGMENWNNE